MKELHYARMNEEAIKLSEIAALGFRVFSIIRNYYAKKVSPLRKQITVGDFGFMEASSLTTTSRCFIPLAALFSHLYRSSRF